MENSNLLVAAFLGVLEGLTEFIPVSSTGHILLAGHFLGFNSTGKSFEVLIQLGAILAIVGVYFARLLNVALALPRDPAARRFVLSVLVAFLPAAFLGALGHDFIKTVLFETPVLICIMLIVGGILLGLVDRLDTNPVFDNAMAYPIPLAFKIGVFQCLALVPGVSRSGATIAGALLMGCNKRSAAEFSFFLAMPTMTGAFVFDLYQNQDQISRDDVTMIVIGFITAFFAALLVVKTLLNFVSKHGFMPFAIWRVIVGTAGLIGLWLVG